MKTRNQNISIFILILMMLLTSCSKQNWYQGAQSAQTANCMKEPLAEYENCTQQSKEDYDKYEETREQLLKEKLKN